MSPLQKSCPSKSPRNNLDGPLPSDKMAKPTGKEHCRPKFPHASRFPERTILHRPRFPPHHAPINPKVSPEPRKIELINPQTTATNPTYTWKSNKKPTKTHAPQNRPNLELATPPQKMHSGRRFVIVRTPFSTTPAPRKTNQSRYGPLGKYQTRNAPCAPTPIRPPR